MNKSESLKFIGPGKLFLNIGPIQMMISAEKKGVGSNELAEAGARKAIKTLEALCRHLDIARSNICGIDRSMVFPKPLTVMLQAARATGANDATPMLAVAGAIAQMVTEKLMKLGADKVVINNGGDIALGLTEGNQTTVGIITDMRAGNVEFVKTIKAGDDIRGVATSGLGGRSLTKGIASSVTVFARTASQADACATIICNATGLDDPRIHKSRAEDIDPNTDIRGAMVTTHVDKLPEELVKKALQQGKDQADRYITEGTICGAVLYLQGHCVMTPEILVTPREEHKKGVM